MEWIRREKSWMVNYIQNKWKLTPKVAEESYRVWLNGLTSDGKIPLKDLQAIYDEALAAKLIRSAVPVPKVVDYTWVDEVLKKKDNRRAPRPSVSRNLCARRRVRVRFKLAKFEGMASV